MHRPDSKLIKPEAAITCPLGVTGEKLSLFPNQLFAPESVKPCLDKRQVDGTDRSPMTSGDDFHKDSI